MNMLFVAKIGPYVVMQENLAMFKNNNDRISINKNNDFFGMNKSNNDSFSMKKTNDNSFCMNKSSEKSKLQVYPDPYFLESINIDKNQEKLNYIASKINLVMGRKQNFNQILYTKFPPNFKSSNEIKNNIINLEDRLSIDKNIKNEDEHFIEQIKNNKFINADDVKIMTELIENKNNSIDNKTKLLEYIKKYKMCFI